MTTEKGDQLRQQLIAAVVKKRAAIARAHQIVVRLLEPGIPEPEFLSMQKYTISASKNKVYDLTERKKFCSGYCFKASEYIKSQVPTSPLWLRDRETRPSFQLLPR
ncbi:hypothetical protein M5D96_004443, partial [Drosophila gunungcola]